MKKLITLALATLFAVTPLCACGEGAQPQTPPDQGEKPESVYTEEELLHIAEEYKRLLFEDDYTYFALVDLDSNGIADLLCLSEKDENDAFIYENGIIKRSPHDGRDTFADGSSFFKRQAGTVHGAYRYINNESVEIEREEVSDDEVRFYIGGVLVNAEETAAYVENFGVGYADWYPVTDKEMIDLKITAENIYLREPPQYIPKNQKFMQYSDIVDMFDALWLSEDRNKDINELWEKYDIPDNEDDRKIFEALCRISKKGGFIVYDAEDINGDGYPELVFLTDKGEIYGIFTVLENLPILVGEYDSAAREYSCYVTADNEIVLDMYSSGENCVTEICVLSSNGRLEEKLQFGRVGNEFYKKENGEKTVISSEQYQKLYGEYSTKAAKSFEHSCFENHPYPDK